MEGRQFVAASLAMTEDVFVQLVDGQLDAMWALLTGKVSMTGSKKQAAKLQAVFSPRDADTEAEAGEADVLPDVHRDKHVAYMNRFLGMLPSFLQSQDTNRITLVFFALSGIDLLGCLDKEISQDTRDDWIDWIYSLQIFDSVGDVGGGSSGGGGGGDTLLGFAGGSCTCGPGHHGHLAMTYTALASLAILGDDFGRVHRHKIAKSLGQFQNADGSFKCTQDGEVDMRFVYCACCTAYMLNDWSGIDMDATEQFIWRSQGYDGGIAQEPGSESHGSTCAALGLPLKPRACRAFAFCAAPTVLRPPPARGPPSAS